MIDFYRNHFCHDVLELKKRRSKLSQNLKDNMNITRSSPGAIGLAGWNDYFSSPALKTLLPPPVTSVTMMMPTDINL